MNKIYSNIKGDPIYSQQDGSLLGLLYDIIINPENGKIEAFWVKPATLPVSNAVILSDVILSWGNKIYIKDEDDIALPEDIIRVSDILSKETFFIGSDVVDEAENLLGKVYDLDFDSKKLYLRSLHVAHCFLGLKFGKRFFSFESIIEVLPKKIIVKNLNSIKQTSPKISKGQPVMDV